MIIASAVQTETQIQYLQQQEIPFILVDRYSLLHCKPPYVVLDNHQAALYATKHLRTTVVINITGLITYNTSLFHMQERTRGIYLDASARERSVLRKVISAKLILQTWKPVCKAGNDQLLACGQPPDAILFTTNLIALCCKMHHRKRIRYRSNWRWFVLISRCHGSFYHHLLTCSTAIAANGTNSNPGIAEEYERRYNAYSK